MQPDSITKPCSACGAVTTFRRKPSGKFRSHCNACKAAYAKAWRANNVAARTQERDRGRRRRRDPVEAQKRVIRDATIHAIKMGRLTRGPCEVCGVEPAEAHHDDYTKPLEVRWLCPHHHRQHHLREAA